MAGGQHLQRAVVRSDHAGNVSPDNTTDLDGGQYRRVKRENVVHFGVAETQQMVSTGAEPDKTAVQLDVSVVNVAIKPIGQELGGGIDGLQWVISAYTIAFAALILTAGALGDRIGAKRATVSVRVMRLATGGALVGRTAVTVPAHGAMSFLVDVKKLRAGEPGAITERARRYLAEVSKARA